MNSIGLVLGDDGNNLGASAFGFGDTAVCASYGLGYYHEFPRSHDRTPIIDHETIAACRRKLSAKYRGLSKKLSDGEPTLFVRFLGSHAHAIPEPSITDHFRPSEIDVMVNALETRFPGLPFHVALVGLAGHSDLSPHLVSDKVSINIVDRYEHWHGDDASWDRVFDRYVVQDRHATQPTEHEYLYA
ncbi:hypothetical protein [Agrobacterium rosae]|uniref:hypothetical protein n=1 Tax=Agrobacterium rosae TaxID=1972867 RepID=UPI00122F2A34|nr:hypothetical protein [Agrobacterium rosae]KAA3510089.1 hypothetical protein DXM21_19865 [Agrobacterium rosae]KAA3514966.1 hypothetical protein DXM25_20505 [Agrobacterium rosae]